MTGKRNSDGSIAPYEINVNYFDAVNDPRAAEPVDVQVQRFLLSQAIPLCLLGMPGIYLHSLLGSRNDYEGVQRTGRARSINREQLQLPRLRAELAEPTSLRARVFRAYRKLLQLRAGQSAFHPNARQEILDLGPAVLAVRRHNLQTGQTITAVHNVTTRSVTVNVPEARVDLLTGEQFTTAPVLFAPYQVRWLTPVARIGYS